MLDGLLGIKSKILDEILEDLDSHEGEKLKPKAAISITAVKPKEELELGDGADHPEPDGDEMPQDMQSALDGKNQDDDDEDLKMLLKHYMGQE